MTHSLEKLASLPKDTLVCCGHEYTINNLEFALSVEPDNEAIMKKLEWARNQREKGESTVPSTVGEEIEYNPFMRLNSASLRKTLNFDGTVSKYEVMAALRELKNSGIPIAEFPSWWKSSKH